MNMMELVKKNRSYRRFYEDRPVTKKELVEFIDIARNTPSGANSQKNRYLVFDGAEGIEKVFPYIRWAGFYKDWDGPEAGERPTGFIVMLKPEGVNTAQDEGIKGQTIMLAAVEAGFGGCFIGNIDREGLKKSITIPEGFEVSLILAIGTPKENVILHDVKATDDLKYYRDGEQNQHVPKVQLKDLILN